MGGKTTPSVAWKIPPMPSGEKYLTMVFLERMSKYAKLMNYVYVIIYTKFIDFIFSVLTKKNFERNFEMS